MALLEVIIGVVAPLSCVICGREGLALCAMCGFEALEPVPPRCFLCLKRTADYRTCSNCRRRVPIRHAWVASEYSSAVANVVKSYKFKRNRALTRPIAKLMAAQLPYFKNTPVIIPVPTATARVRQRGYDHALRLAGELAAQTGWPMVEHLRRIGQARQVGAKRMGRIEQLRGAFRPIRMDLLAGRDVLLVDDVITTGATVSEAARTLKSAGAKSISVLAVAHKS
jgi:ComF family protein